MNDRLSCQLLLARQPSSEATQLQHLLVRRVPLSVGSRIKERRSILRLNQTELAERVGVIKQTVSHWETGKNRVPLGKLTALANALEVNAHWLLFGEEGDTVSPVKVVGIIRRGGTVEHTESSAELAPNPPGAIAGMLESFRVEASSLSKFSPGDIVYVDREAEYRAGDCMGRACIVDLADGRSFLRYVEPGDTADTVTLSSDSAPEMRNVRLLRCRPILFAMFA